MERTPIRVIVADDAAMGERNRELLDIDRALAARMGQEAVRIAQEGRYQTQAGALVDLGDAIARMRQGTVSLRPELDLPRARPRDPVATLVRVVNTTTTAAGASLEGRGFRTLALNFANGVHFGGAFLSGAQAQEESLCRSSALWSSLRGDPMYHYHQSLPTPTSSDWCILSPRVPFFRSDAGDLLPEPWFLDVLTCAAPVAFRLGVGEAQPLLRRRIGRVLAVARAYEYRSLVLGAWGCGAFGNDPVTTAADFAEALAGEFRGAFDEVVFAITDSSRTGARLGPFRDAMSALAEP